MAHASKSYGGTPALREASLELRGGEVHALMGENGAGKSTLIKILAGVVAADSLEARLRGRPIAIGSAAEAHRHGFRFLHQELSVVAQMSVAENLFLSRPYPTRSGLFVDWRALRRAATAALAQLGIDHIDPGIRMARLGTGDRMLVRIAAALHDEGDEGASLYVLDEPTAALSGEETARLFRAVSGLTARGRAVLYVSHRLDEVFALCDRVTVMRDGATVAGHPVAATDRRRLIREMTGRDMAGAYPQRSRPIGERVVLELQGVHGRRLRGIDLRLREGEIVGVAGLAGSGGSELLRTLAGADPLLAGTIRLDGVPLRPRGPADAWRRGIAFVPQERRSQGLVLSRSVRDNITWPHLRRLSRGGVLLAPGREDAAARDLGKRVGLRARGPRQPSHQLSGGNQQKVVFARALAAAPKLLLLDEPTRGVDVGAKYDLHELIRTLSDRGAAALIASSDLAELLGMSDRLIVLRGGRPAGVVAASGLTQETLLALCYGDGDPGGDAPPVDGTG